MDSEFSVKRPRKWAWLGVGLIGVAFIVMPLVFNMFERAPKGATMLKEFKPFMTTARLDGYQSEIGQIRSAVHEVQTPAVTQGASPLPAPVEALDQQWPQIDATMTNLLDNVQSNLGNYKAVAALPSFTLFPWFFVLPGAILLGAAGLALLDGRSWRRARTLTVAVGVGLVLGPAVFQMFTRAPDGGRMMSTFRTIETTSEVEQIQGFFSSMASGQGAMQLQVVPALERSGMTPSQFPAIAELDANWVHILNDMTPMIGAMSDNVSRYQAIASLPPFPLFPWFFVGPGLIVAGLALAAGPAPERSRGLRTVLAAGLAGIAALGGCGSSHSTASTTAGHGTPLVGLFRLDPGQCTGTSVTGTYFRMIDVGGTLAGKFFQNPYSTCPDKSYTLGAPGADGGFYTGRYQPDPVPAFNQTGGALANKIVAPQNFTGIYFSMSTNQRDPQTRLNVPTPAVFDSGGALSGQIEAWSAAWNNEYFNQGTPKPNGQRPGLTSPLSGTYNAATHQFVLTWASQVVGGPFNGFTGYWHLQGTFVAQ